NAPYDRALADHVRMIKHEVGQQRLADGIALPSSVINILHGDPDQIVHWEIRDANGRSLGGNGSIPLPEHWAYERDKIRFSNETMHTHSVRVAYMWGGTDLDGVPFMTISAQSNEMRATLQQEILT